MDITLMGAIINELQYVVWNFTEKTEKRNVFMEEVKREGVISATGRKLVGGPLLNGGPQHMRGGRKHLAFIFTSSKWVHTTGQDCNSENMKMGKLLITLKQKF